MRNYPIAVIAAAVLFASCGGSKTASTTQPSVAATAMAASGDCGFAKTLATPAPGTTPKPITDADIDKAVGASPAEIKGDVRVVLTTSKHVTEVSKQIQNLPPQQRAQKAMEMSQSFVKPEYMTAVKHMNDYMRAHCPNLVPSPR